MSHPTPTGNGCSLEDCHTNLFALTDLSGIKWRKLRVKVDYPESVDPVDDPVLYSYAKCIQSDVLSVWRKVQSGEQSPDAKSNEPGSFTKELWIFWYGDQPSNLASLISDHLTEAEQGSWDNGLSYECRTLLFKALHNLIERCLLSKNFVRLGKWFVQPYDRNSTSRDKSSHLSISFNFFLHGESTVCASIDVCQHPPVRRLTPQHLQLAAGNHSQLPVILAPYGLAGILTGHICKENEPITRKLLDDWKQFYPINDPDNDQRTGDEKLSPCVEVIVSGMRMRYPSCYVLVSDSDHASPMLNSGMVHGNTVSAIPLTPPTSPCDGALAGETSIKVMPTSAYVDNSPETPSTGAETVPLFGRRVIEKVCQDNCVTAAASKRTTLPENASTEDSMVYVGTWDFTDPTLRSNCQCSRSKSKSRALSGGKSGSGGKLSKIERQEKLERQQSRRNTSSFHRRSPVNDLFIQEAEMIVQSVPMSTGWMGYKRGLQDPGSVHTPDTRFSTGVGTPHSAAPSPLIGSNESNMGHTVDPTMPTLSPHPPSNNAKEQASGNVQSESRDATSQLNQTSEQQYVKNTVSDIKTEQLTSPLSNAAGNSAKNDSVSNWLELHSKLPVNGEPKILKRPMLPTTVHEIEDSANENSLYDYKMLQTWFDYPVKRFKPGPAKPDSAPSRMSYQPSIPESSSTHHSSSSSRQQSPAAPVPPMVDPYEFSDESSQNAGSFTTAAFRRRSRESSSIKQEDDCSKIDANGIDSPFTPGGTQQSKDMYMNREKDILAPKFSDLDHMFDSDEESNNDDAFQAPTSPGSNRMMDIKMKNSSITNSGNDLATVPVAPTTTDLTRMYPTPPSLESHTSTAQSPGVGVEGSTDIMIADINTHRLENAVLRNPIEERSLKDCMYVFRPPTKAKFAGAPKYAPIELPSSKLPLLRIPSDYKPSWLYNIHPPMPIMDKHLHNQLNNQYINIPSVENVPSISRQISERIDASPATFQNISQQRTPMSFDLQSPASNASSYLNKTSNSVEYQGTNYQRPEAHSLVVNVALSDSILNLFKDHNFDSCNICVCNMDIKGSDVGIYVPDTKQEPRYKCTCGFSAVTNRRYGYGSGLFYEDEVDITGYRDDRYERRKPSLLAVEYQKQNGDKNIAEEDIPENLLLLIHSQFSNPFGSLLVQQKFNHVQVSNTTSPKTVTNLLFLQDASEASSIALDQGRQVVDTQPNVKLEETMIKSTCLHKWPYSQNAGRPNNSLEVIRLLKSLQPLLQDAIQRKRTSRLWERAYNISGPLSWKDFHKMAGRGQEEACEPQPIPSFLVGHDKDWMTLSPHSVRFWEKLQLRPFGKARDVAYVVVAPDNDYMLSHMRTFFRELSTVYELSRLGRHAPVDKLRDGILRVGKNAYKKVVSEDIDNWFKQIGDSLVTSKLRLYAKACRHLLAPLLNQQSNEKSFFESNASKQQQYVKSQPVPSPSPAQSLGPEGQPRTPQSSEDKDGDPSGNMSKESQAEVEHDENNESPAVVVYLIDPFTYNNDWEDLNRLSVLGLMRCFQEMLPMLQESLQNSISLQIVPLQNILEYDAGKRLQVQKSVSLSVYAQCKRTITTNILGRILTGFGPAAQANEYLKKNAKGGPKRLYCPPYILASQKDTQTQLAESCGTETDDANILFCGYCLSEDQRWLIVTVTDAVGELLETCNINIEIPNRNQRKKASARKIGLKKMWEFVLGVVSSNVMPVRIVIGRMGRLGHGELKGWAGLLSRKSLLLASQQIRQICNECAFLPASDMPCILSACLISFEAHSSFHLMTDSVKNEEKAASNVPCNTPHDASTTHVLVFPTSATAQANSHAYQSESHLDIGNIGVNIGGDMGDDDLFSGLKDDLDIGMDQDLNALFGLSNSPLTSPVGSPNHHQGAPGSPSLGPGGRHSPSHISGQRKAIGSTTLAELEEETPNLLQQPLAMGYYLSSARPGPLPKWFWSACPQAENNGIASFKAALHVHNPSIQLNQDELFHASHKQTHPLDSNLTCDVLRYVLESYNSLSWLTVDPVTNDRRSCLPVHFLVMMQLYHALNAYV